MIARIEIIIASRILSTLERRVDVNMAVAKLMSVTLRLFLATHLDAPAVIVIYFLFNIHLSRAKATAVAISRPYNWHGRRSHTHFIAT